MFAAIAASLNPAFDPLASLQDLAAAELSNDNRFRNCLVSPAHLGSKTGIYLREESLHSIRAASYSFDLSCRHCVSRGPLQVDI